MRKERICQSCAMPLDEKGELWGREANGALNADYCKYCYDHGGFTSDVTMEEMIEFCVPIMLSLIHISGHYHPFFGCKAGRTPMRWRNTKRQAPPG